MTDSTRTGRCRACGSVGAYGSKCPNKCPASTLVDTLAYNCFAVNYYMCLDAIIRSESEDAIGDAKNMDAKR